MLKKLNKEKFNDLTKQMREAKLALNHVQKSMLIERGNEDLVEEEKRATS